LVWLSALKDSVESARTQFERNSHHSDLNCLSTLRKLSTLIYLKKTIERDMISINPPCIYIQGESKLTDSRPLLTGGCLVPTQLALKFDDVPVTSSTQERYHAIAPCLAGLATPDEAEEYRQQPLSRSGCRGCTR
jgi:hypothetical protein